MVKAYEDSYVKEMQRGKEKTQKKWNERDYERRDD